MRLPSTISGLLLAVTLVASCTSVDPTRFDESLRLATFDQYLERMKLDHEGLYRHGRDVQDLARRHRNRAASSETPEEFYRVLAGLLLDLNDPHVDLTPPEDKNDTRNAAPGECEFVRCGNDLVVGLIGPSGAWRWEPVIAVGGREVSEVYEARFLRWGPRPEPLCLVVRDDKGKTVERLVERDAILIGHGSQEILVHMASKGRSGIRRQLLPEKGERFVKAALVGTAEFGPPAKRFEVESWRLDKTAYLRVSSFRLPPGETKKALRYFEKAIADAFAGFTSCDSLVLDLRGNPGGDWLSMGLLLSRFLEDDTNIPFEVVERKRYFLGLFEHRLRRLLTRAPVPRSMFDSIVVLQDQETGSAAEVVASALRKLKSATLIGERTVGAEYAVVRVEGIDGSRIQFGGSGGMRDGCEEFQGTGLAPDIEISLALSDLQLHGLGGARALHERAVLERGLQEVGLRPSDWLK